LVLSRNKTAGLSHLFHAKKSFDVVTGSFDDMSKGERHLDRLILNPVTDAVIRDDRR
jgi:hypothetical protein